MKNAIKAVICAGAFAFGASVVWAKLPPPPPLDEKGKAAAEKAKADLAAAEDKMIKNYQSNMKKAAKPIPKPTPIVAAAAPAKPGDAKAAAKPADAKAPAKADEKKK